MKVSVKEREVTQVQAKSAAKKQGYAKLTSAGTIALQVSEGWRVRKERG